MSFLRGTRERPVAGEREGQKMNKARAGAGRFLPDAVALAVLIAVSAGVGTVFLNRWPGEMGTAGGFPYLEPSAMFACGRGFVVPEPGAMPPALEAFLEHRRDTFSPVELPVDCPVTEPSSYHQRHKYVICLVGLFWRLFGISWGTMEALLVVLLCMTVALVYGLFRLGTGRAIAFFGGILYVSAPWVLATLPGVRDFSKAPFILGCFLVLGVLVSKPVSRPVFLGMSAFLGVSIGTGLGFRHDIIICLPASLCVVAFCARRRLESGSASRTYLGERAAAIVLMLVCFTVASRPLTTAYEDSGCPSHDILVGFGTEHESQLGLDPASYEHPATGRDDYVLAATTCHARRVDGRKDIICNLTARYEEAGRKRLLDMARQFPADMVTRAYAAVSWTLGYSGFEVPPTSLNNPLLDRLTTLRRPLKTFLWRCRFVLVAAVLMAMAARSPRRAFLTLFLVLYFGGYICLQYEDRHFFHLAFVPVWFAGVAVDRVARLGGTLARGPDRREIWGRLRSPRQWWSPGFRRALVFGVGVAAALLLPLYSLRAYQVHAVGKLVEQYAAADLEPLETDRQSVGDWVCFRPVAPLACQAFAFFGPSPGPGVTAWSLPGDYLVAEFAPAPEPRVFRLRYETDYDSAPGFSSVQRVRASGEKGQGTSSFFFEVHECMGGYSGLAWGRFAGIALPKEYADEFKGLYRVSNAAEFRLWPNLWLPADRSLLRPYQRLRFEGGLVEPTWWPGEPAVPAWWRSGFLESAGSTGVAIARLRDDLEQDPGDVGLHVALAEELEAQGMPDAAIDAYLAVIRGAPLFFMAYDMLDVLIGEREGLDGRIAQWRRLVNELPDCAHPRFCLGRALAEQGDLDAAVEAYREAGRLNPGTPAVPWAIGDLLAAQNRWEEALDAYRQAVRLSPVDEPSIEVSIADALEGSGDLAGAVRVCRSALKNDPTSGKLGYRLGVALEKQGDAEAAIEAYLATIAVAPGLFQAYEGLDRLLEGHRTVEERTAVWQDLAATHFDTVHAHFFLGRALEQQGDVDGALDAYRAAIDIEPDSFALHQSVYALLSTKTDIDGQESEWRSITEARPDSPHAWFYLGVVLEGTGDLGPAIDAYERAIELDPSGWASYERLGTALDKSGDWARALDAYRQARRLCPDNSTLSAVIAELYQRRAAELEQQGDTDGALDAHRKAVVLDPANSTICQAFYALLSTKTDIDGQESEWRSITEARPDSPHAWFYLGIVLQANGDVGGAIQAYRRGIEIDPSSSFTQRNLGVLLAREGDHQAAIGPLQEAIDAHPEFDDARVALLEALVETKQEDLAREQLRTCREREVTVPAALVDALSHL